MQTYIALLRGINVGGHTSLTMKDLKTALASLGLENIRTYIQSGNVVFSTGRQAPEPLAARLAKSIADAHGITPALMVLPAEDLAAAARQNPFPEAVEEPKSLHLFLLSQAPDSPDLDGMAALAANGERFRLIDRYYYLHAPAGIGRSKLAAKTERLLGVTVTARNWRTVTTLLEMAGLAE